MFPPKAYDDEGNVVDNSIDVLDGISGPSGTEYVLIKQRLKPVWLATDLFSPDPGPGFRELTARGIKLFTPKQKGDLTDQIYRRTFFPAGEIVERIGHDTFGFGYPDGRVFSNSPTPPPVAYKTGSVCVTQRGTLDEWKTEVAGFVRDQHLPVFCLMVAFTAPLLSLSHIQGNYMFMLSGMPRKGKTTFIDLMTSVCGPALDATTGRYSLKFNNTMNRLEEWLPFYADLPVIIDELSSHGTKASRTSDFRTLVHHLAGVDARGRMGDEIGPAKQTRTIVVMTSNDTASELLGHESVDVAAAAAVEDRLAEIPLPTSPGGAFNAVEANDDAASRYADALRARVGNYHGSSMPAFLQCLVKHRHDDETALLAGIEKRISDFA